MNNIHSIYTTVSNGQLRIAADTNYIGSVNSYNNCFTQFFAWLFNRSVKVSFDDKVRIVNKQSYTRLIQSLSKKDKINDLCQTHVFRSIVETLALPKCNLKMRDVISQKDGQALFKKLAIAISKGDTEKALLMVGKGANLDTEYCDRGLINPSFGNDSWHLSLSPYKFTVFKASPLVQAAKKGNQRVCQFLKSAGANLSACGSEYTFERTIEKKSVDLRLHLKYNETLGHQCFMQLQTIYTPQDSRFNVKNYQLDPNNFSLKKI